MARKSKGRRRPKSKAAALPLLVAPPEAEATRVFTFAQPRGATIRLVEALHRAPQGLYRLQASQCSRAQYQAWVTQMTRSTAVGGLPQRVRTGPQMERRKRWEVAAAVNAGRVGAEVDPDLAMEFTHPGEPPPHPALSLALGDGPLLSVAELADAPHRLRPFIQRSAHQALRSQWEELGGSVLIDSGPTGNRVANLRAAAADWGAQWGAAALTELLLDSAVFHFALGNRDVARTFRAVGMGEEQAIEFLRSYVEWLASTGFDPDPSG